MSNSTSTRACLLPFAVTCDICGKLDAGRGRTLAGALFGLTQHRKNTHKLEPAPRERRRRGDPPRFTLPCDVCGRDDAGRGVSLKGAQSGLGFHKRRAHGIVGTSQNAGIGLNTSDILMAIREWSHETGFSFR